MLKGETVELRALERSDLGSLWAWFNDVEVQLPAGGDIRPESRHALASWFDKELEDGPPTRFGIVVGGLLIGWCGLFDWDDALSLRLAIGVGEKSYWSRGHGREAVSLLIGYAFRHRNAHKVWLEVAADNERAIRSYRSCGFVEEGRIRETAWRDGRYVDELVMGVLRGEWEQLKTTGVPGGD